MRICICSGHPRSAGQPTLQTDTNVPGSKDSSIAEAGAVQKRFQSYGLHVYANRSQAPQDLSDVTGRGSNPFRNRAQRRAARPEINDARRNGTLWHDYASLSGKIVRMPSARFRRDTRSPVTASRPEVQAETAQICILARWAPFATSTYRTTSKGGR